MIKHLFFPLLSIFAFFVKAQVAPVCFNSLITNNSSLVGSYPIGLCTADFDNDGKKDIAVANNNSSNLSVMISLGNGMFSPAVNYATGANPWTICTADFNLDGYADLVTGNQTGNNYSVLLGSSGGVFATAVNYGVGSSIASVCSGDFNSDGKPDLALLYGSLVRIYHGSGTGTFSLYASYAAGSSPNMMCTGDFNGDAKPDIAVLNNSSGTVNILLASGSGFATSVAYATGTAPYGLASGDLNLDGKDDLTVCNYSSGNISVLLSTPSGTFAPSVFYPAGTNPSSATIDDFNGDGKPDMAIANLNSRNISVYLGTGAGAFTSGINYTLIDTPFFIVSADFNSDGAPDLATSGYTYNKVSVILGNGNGAFAAAIGYSVGATPFCVRSADLNADSKPDLVVANMGSNNISVLLGLGNGSFLQPVNYTVGTQPEGIAFGDFNSDGKPDIAVNNFNSANISVLLGSSTGTFSPAVNFAVATLPTSIGAGDFNNDGKPDLVVTCQSGTVMILIGNGSGGFAASASYTTGGAPSAVDIADLNSDGNQDLAVSNIGTNQASIFLGSSSGTFATAVNYMVGASPLGISLTDFNGDLKKDIVTANSAAGLVSVLLGNGSGGFGSQNYFTVNSSPYCVSTGDYNGDGVNDIVTATYSSAGNISVLLGTGSGGFIPQTSFAVSSNPRSIASGDFNADGKTDLVVANAFANSISILLNGSPTVSLSATSTVCLGNSINITAYGANTYTWSTSFIGNPLVVSPTSLNSYTVFATSFGGCAGTAAKSVTVNALPLPTITVNSGTVCVGQSFTILPSGANSYSISGGQSVVSPTVTKTYTVIGTNTNTGCYSNPVFSGVTVNPLPTITVSNGTLCAGQTYTIMASGASSYNFPGGSPVVSPVSSTFYPVTGISSQGCVSLPAYSSVAPFPLPIIAVNSGSICAGKSFTMIPAGAPSYSYASGSSIVTPASTASYVVYGVSAQGCLSAPAVSQVTVIPLPTVLISGNNSVCSGSFVSLIASGSATSYSWSNGVSGNLVTLSPTQTTVYTVTGTANNCHISVTKTITVNPTPVIAVNSGSLCITSFFTLNPSGAVSYTYSGGTPLVSPAITTVYTVTGSDIHACVGSVTSTVVVMSLPLVVASVDKTTTCAGETIIMTGSGTSSYLWSTGATSVSIAVNPTVTTQYTLTGTDNNGCSNAVSFVQNVEACLSVNQLSGASSRLAVYPNPNNGQFIIESSEALTVKIINAIGQIIKEEELAEGENKIDLGNYSNGIYFISCKSAGFDKTIRLIKY